MSGLRSPERHPIRVSRGRGLFLTLALLGCCGGLAQGAGPADRASRPVVLSLQGDRLSATIAQAPLREVLAELARQARLRVSMSGPVAEERVSVSFRGAGEGGVRS